MTDYLLDTNCLLRFLLDDVPSQASQTELLLKKAARQEINVTLIPIVVVETVFTLTKSYAWPKEKVVEILLQIVASPDIAVPDRSVLITALNFYRQHSVGFTDCLLLATARETGKELYTFDRRLKSLAKV